MISEFLNSWGQAPRPPNGMADFSSILSQLPPPKLAPHYLACFTAYDQYWSWQTVKIKIGFFLIK